MPVNARKLPVKKDESAALTCASKKKLLLHQLPVDHAKPTRFKHTGSINTQDYHVMGLASS